MLAKANADRSLAAEGGRVEIRYKPNDGRAYRAGVSNLVVSASAALLPDDACVAAGDAPAKKSPSSSASPSPSPSLSPSTSWTAYTDGACSGNPGPAGAGFVVIMPGGKMHEGFEYLGEATNNIAELTAVLRAVEAMPPSATGIVVRTDSQYSIGVLQKNWKAKANQELVAKIKTVVKARGAKLEYVRGHQGDPLNERADELARLAITTRSTQRVAVDR